MLVMFFFLNTLDSGGKGCEKGMAISSHVSFPIRFVTVRVSMPCAFAVHVFFDILILKRRHSKGHVAAVSWHVSKLAPWGVVRTSSRACGRMMVPVSCWLGSQTTSRISGQPVATKCRQTWLCQERVRVYVPKGFLHGIIFNNFELKRTIFDVQFFHLDLGGGVGKDSPLMTCLSWAEHMQT